jgi:hypothetical protein
LAPVTKEHSHDFKSMVMLQNCMGLVKGEPGSCSITPSVDETEESTKAEEAIDIKEENDGEAKTLPVMETEHTVRLFVYMCVCVCSCACVFMAADLS